ncbi:MAG: tRNA (adenosine(37)-N6)-threonylcarbamoyltransferase complex dimerization subunit type 1 TsaB [Alphaproteobacteria bacterium]|nr:tRNA (adenosine(37)-N6)-threonylcarbamoyltransferase complex dimerization subunit type 1 TsaB [Alphaproteobacteria bacterium]MCL2889804.1 tRNA (adenosine(37)-N6)-threonylcarbamoyltransferase complex dimerization subunit type 1 TsaB [Alphaproteobacteria bacterium]
MILIIDASSPGIRLALQVVCCSVIPAKAGPPIQKSIETDKQSTALPIEVEFFLTENGVTFRDLMAIGIVVGPGSFTGIRLGIAYAKGLSIGLGVPVVPVNAFEIYLERTPDAFVAIDSGRGDFFVGAHDLVPMIMSIDEVETQQMKYSSTIGHKPFDLTDALPVITRKLSGEIEPVIPLYIRPHYAETNCKSS